ncbi:Glycosyltransferase involved in cell wall bisynthesis [Planctomycetales bacterium 10988]|nr:Glycosyltransferase involved in cell wall bisynthesis [Planctomycetales bacterium 10988]
MNDPYHISAVIPVYNEEESLRELHQELKQVAKEQNYELEVVFIDDGSTDQSWEVIEEIAKDDPKVQGWKFRRNFGKAAALMKGFQAADGDIIITLDADLQDDPQMFPQFLEKMEEGYDVVSGYKKTRHDPWHKVYPSRVFNWMVGVLTGVKLHDHNCGMKAYRKEVVREVRLYGELHRFVPVLAAARGFRINEIVVNHRPRKFGVSKYGVHRFVKGFLDLLTVTFLTGYGRRPQHVLGVLGLASFALGGLSLVYLALCWVIANLFPSWEWTPLHQRPLVIYSVAALLLGSQLLSMGLLAEMLASYHAQHEEPYVISKKTPSTITQEAEETMMNS